MSTTAQDKLKLTTLKSIIQQDIPGCDMKFSLFVSSAITYRYDSCCTPFPVQFKNDQSEKDITRLTASIESLPSMKELLTTNDEDLLRTLTSDNITLLYWLFVEAKGPVVRTVAKKDFSKVLEKTPQETSIKNPTHIFEVQYRENSSQEMAFQAHAKDFNTSFAFHGTKLFYLHNILHQGLQQHLSKTALFGDGLYLSSELNVSLPYSHNGLGWNNSIIGDSLSCVALCEFVEHPIFSKHCLNKDIQKPPTELPEKYIIVSNNDCVRLRYLVVYATKTSHHKSHNSIPGRVSGQQETPHWTRWLNFRTLSVVYLLILVFVGMSDSPYLKYLKKSLLRKLQSSFRVLLGRE